MTILHIDSSILDAHSVTRSLSAAIVARLTEQHPDTSVVRRDLVANPIDPLTPAHIAAFNGATVSDPVLVSDLGVGDTLIAEIMSADMIVIGAPMYNFGLPVQLKTWIDRILVAGKTFRYGPNGPEGLVPAGKRVFVASARGGVYGAGSPPASSDHQETQLETVLAFIGLADVTVIRAEGVAMGDDARAQAIAGANAEIQSLAA